MVKLFAILMLVLFGFTSCTTQHPQLASKSFVVPVTAKTTVHKRHLFGATGQSSTQLLSYQDIVDNVAAGNFVYNSGAPSGSTQIIDRANFIAYIKNNGACNAGGNANYVLTYGDMTACRVLTSTIAATTDPCITNGANWPAVSGTAAYTAFSTAIGGCGSGYYISGATWTAAQSLNGGASLISGTTIKVTAYLEVTSQTNSYVDTDCATSVSQTATGTAKVEILDSANTVVAATSSGVNGFTAFTASFTVATAGVYKAAVYEAPQTVQHATYHLNVNSLCVTTSNTTANGYGYATDITASN